jgi:hypothetical protein
VPAVSARCVVGGRPQLQTTRSRKDRHTWCTASGSFAAALLQLSSSSRWCVNRQQLKGWRTSCACRCATVSGATNTTKHREQKGRHSWHSDPWCLPPATAQRQRDSLIEENGFTCATVASHCGDLDRAKGYWMCCVCNPASLLHGG